MKSAHRRLSALLGGLLLAGAASAVPPGTADGEFDGIVDLFDSDYLHQPIRVARLPLRHAITIVHGRGERVVYTFEDPECGYCRELGRRLAKIGNVTVHTFVVALLGESSRAKLDRAWCAPDRAAAWQHTMAGTEVAAAPSGCKGPLDHTMKLAEMLGINFTPTVFFADGSRMVGLKPVEEIEARLRAAGLPAAQ